MQTPLALYMTKKQLTDAQMAQLVGRDRSVITKIRRGQMRPSLELAGIIEDATGGEVPMQAWREAA